MGSYFVDGLRTVAVLEDVFQGLPDILKYQPFAPNKSIELEDEKHQS